MAERSIASVCKTEGASPRRSESGPHVQFPNQHAKGDVIGNNKVCRMGIKSVGHDLNCLY